MITVAASLRCQQCGTVACASITEADQRAEQHTKVTGHATCTEAVRTA